MSVDLTRIATVELMKELERRVNCSNKREKRTIFFGPPGMKSYESHDVYWF